MESTLLRYLGEARRFAGPCARHARLCAALVPAALALAVVPAASAELAVAPAASVEPLAARASLACGDAPCYIAVAKQGSGRGLVTSQRPGIFCGDVCYMPTEFDERITLHATPEQGSVFTGWGGDCDQIAGADCYLHLELAKHVVAVFDLAGAPPTPIDPPRNPPPPPPASAPAPPGCAIAGTPGNDVLYGTVASETICGLGGNDHIHGRGGRDVIRGGLGNDELEGQDGNDRLEGGAGRDVLAGGPGRDDLRARDGARDRVSGGDGSDTARVDHRDVMRGVERRYASPTAGRPVSASRGCAGPCILNLQIRGFGSGLVTTDPPELACRADCSTSGIAPSTVVTLTATPDEGSRLTRFEGCSAISPTRCRFEMPASDIYLMIVFDRIGGATTPPSPGVEVPAPTAPVVATPPPAGCTIGGTSGNDVVSGTAGNDVICTLGGDDHVHGGGGNDVIRAGSGDDIAEGQAGNDRIEGGAGGDTLVGSAGRDRLVGGAGPDRLDGGSAADELLARDGGRDVVRGGLGRDVARVDRRDRLAGIERRA